MKKIKQFISCLLPLLYYLIISGIAYFIAFSVYVKVNRMPFSTDMFDLNSTALLILYTGSMVTCIPVFGLWYKKLIKGDNKSNIRVLFTRRNLMGIALLGISLQISIGIILNTLASIKPQWFESYINNTKFLVEGNPWLVLINVGFIAPILEEFIFRGVILKKFSRIMPFAVANILQALLFGIVHGNIIQGSYTFVGGLFKGFIYKKTNSIIGPILLHMAFNMSSIILGSISLVPSEKFYLPVILTISFLISIVTIIWSLKIINIDNKAE